jgi:hypothetical protein
MKKNMSNIDRIIRTILAVIFAVLFFGHVVTGWLGIILLILAVVFLVTAAISFCPLYALFKISTLKK